MPKQFPFILTHALSRREALRGFLSWACIKPIRALRLKSRAPAHGASKSLRQNK